MSANAIVKSFSKPDEVRTFEKGRFELIHAAGQTLGRATYQPGWKWSVHVAPIAGTPLCQVAHLGVVLSGRCMVKMDDGREFELRAGDVFEIGPGHDSWVIGDQPYVSLHLLGAGQYAK